MSKRRPTSELNDRNWDVEEEPEEAGTFRLANQDVLNSRIIRKAKRTTTTGGSSSGSLFAGFALKTSDSSAPKPSLSTGVTLNFGSTLNLQNKSNGTAKNSSSVNNVDSHENPDYLRQLKVLNENILSWIQKHVGENPYCILTPSFKDYEKHLTDLENMYRIQGRDKSQEEGSKVVSSAVSESKAEPSTFDVGSKPIGSGFTLGQTSDKPSNTGTSFTFGTGLTPSTGLFGASKPTQSTGDFSFASSKPFSSSVANQPSSGSSTSNQESGTGNDDEEYQPPKVEVREIKEDGAVYTKRCKLFYQKGGQWVDRGVGNLHLKPTDDDRTQLIIRADTNLGNILLNIILSSAVPTKRNGKNNVFLVCVPNPPINPKEPTSDPTPMLIRVKTGEDADELLAKMEELKKG